jgi:hypothetical protein
LAEVTLLISSSRSPVHRVSHLRCAIGLGFCGHHDCQQGNEEEIRLDVAG